MDQHQKVAEIIKERGYVVAFTGAGISVDSGIPAFRGGQGLWEKYDPMEYAHIQAFQRDPEKVWRMLREMAQTVFEAHEHNGVLLVALAVTHLTLNWGWVKANYFKKS